MPSPRRLANAIRLLSIDAVERAQSGHPGMPLGMSDVAQVLWHEFLAHAPSDPSWVNRDRFVLSNGHGSMLLYALLYLCQYDLSLEDLKQFRQLHSKTPGHPEFGFTPGVEASTGPLGQGLGNAVGMALGEQLLARQFNRPGHELINHFTYCFVGDGCLMEGISHEVASFAGLHKLAKLIVFWDDNQITIDGPVSLSSSEDTRARFRAYDWHVLSIDGHDSQAIRQAIIDAQQSPKPSLIACKTIIGFGAPQIEGRAIAHGAPLGPDNILAAKLKLNWPFAPFEIPEDIREAWNARAHGEKRLATWHDKFEAYCARHPELAQAFEQQLARQMSPGAGEAIKAMMADERLHATAMSSRRASRQVLQVLSPYCPFLIGGSADLGDSTQTLLAQAEPSDGTARHLHYGIRELGMAAIMNGLSLQGGYVPYGGTFLVFSDYARSAIRMAAQMKQASIFVFTHDSIGLGEDGPSHQPTEHLAMLRMTPNLSVWRPANLMETLCAWRAALAGRPGPTALVLSRQDLAPIRPEGKTHQPERGAYIVYEPPKAPDALMIATGSELGLCLTAAKSLAERWSIRVVSMPSIDIFKAQSDDYRNEILPKSLEFRMAVEAGSPDTWYQFVGFKGVVVGLDSYGASGPGAEVMASKGFELGHIIAKLEQMLRSEV